MKRFSLIIAFLVFAFLSIRFIGFASVAFGETYYVSKDGNDNSPGTLSEPWKTVQHAADTLVAGDTVYIREGTYSELITIGASGTSGNPITFIAYPTETVKITYTSTTSENWTINGYDYITIDGLTFDGDFHVSCGLYFLHAEHITVQNCIIKEYECSSHDGGTGIWINGSTDYITVQDTDIYHNGSAGNPTSQSGGNVHIRRGGGTSRNNHITFTNCNIYESYTEDGIQAGSNAEEFNLTITNCNFWNNKEDGIDIKLVSTATITNCTFYGHTASVTGGGAGVVIQQGARYITVESCTIYNNDHGFEITETDGRSTENITVRNCVIRDNEQGIIGGEPDSADIDKLYIYNNVFYNNDAGIHWWYFHANTHIRNNIFLESTDQDIYFPDSTVSGLTLDYNDYPEGGKLNFDSNIYTRASLEAALGYESHGLSVDPLFRDESNYDFYLKPSSALIDQGVDLGLPYYGSAPDIGAFEYNGDPASPPAPPAGLRIVAK